MPVSLPLFAGIAAACLAKPHRAIRLTLCLLASCGSAFCCVYSAFNPGAETSWQLSSLIPMQLRADGIGVIFATVASLGWLAALVYSFKYMDEYSAKDESRFYCFFMISEAALLAMCYASDIVTMYLFYEMLTLFSMPLVLHDRTKESIAAALKYLFYSVGGAFCALLGLFMLNGSGALTSIVFRLSGYALQLTTGNTGVALTGAFLLCMGFSVKAGMYPMHGWLPTAHPEAPSPASAVLSGLIAKAGLLGMIRVLYCLISPASLAGTWVQTTLIILALFTVFMGSMMAYREKLFKKRLAYSTVSQISYAVLGVLLLSDKGLEGAMLQLIFHAMVKIALFMTAGSVIYATGKKNVDELKGLGRTMPLTMAAFTLASLSLIGIPPTGGFATKMVLALAAMDSGLGAFCWLIPVVLLVSALLTAAYLLSISVSAFFPGKDTEITVSGKDYPCMWIPIAVLAVLALVLGMCSDQVVTWITSAVLPC